MGFELIASAKRCDSLARRMIYNISDRSQGSNKEISYLVVNVGDVHNKVDIVPKVIPQYPSNDILCQVVSTESA